MGYERRRSHVRPMSVPPMWPARAQTIICDPGPCLPPVWQEFMALVAWTVNNICASLGKESPFGGEK